MTLRRQIILGVGMRYLGYHAAAWRHPAADPGAASDFRHFLRVARIAEAAKLDMVFLADGNAIRGKDEPPGSLQRSAQNAELEPLTLLSALAPMTRRIGLVATASTTYNEPWHIARKFASLDRISGGRAGWNIVTSWSDAEAQNFGRDHHPDHDSAYARAGEFVEVVKGLWDSWDEDAFLHDKASGIFYDPAKLHLLDHRGPHFRVRGPLSVARSPQGRPVLVQAGASETGKDLAAAHADIAYAVPHDIETGRAYRADLLARLERHGRAPGSLKVLPAVTPFVGRTESEAREKYDALNALITPELGLSYLYAQFGDLSGHDPDGPMPELDVTRLRSMPRNILAAARRDGLTIRQLYTSVAAAHGCHIMIGTPARIVDEMEAWVAQGAADGFNICPPVLPVGLEDFVALVLPELRRRGMFRTEYQGRTLREIMGLPEPASRYAAGAPPRDAMRG